MNRRGNVFDVILILGIVFLAVIMSVVGIKFMNTFTQAINSTTSSNFDTAKTATQNFNNDVPSTLDFILLMIAIGFPLASMVLAFFNNIHPLFFYATTGVVIFIVLVGGAYGTLYEKFAATSIGQEGAVSLPMMNFIMSHFGLYAILTSVIVLFGTYVKIRSAGY